MSDFTPADMKAILAEHGQTMKPDAKLHYLETPAQGEGATLLVLDRVVKDVVPEYCTHGYATCINCSFPCWIGHATEKTLLGGEALPICKECAAVLIPPEHRTPIGRVVDHLRADGPHE